MSRRSLSHRTVRTFRTNIVRTCSKRKTHSVTFHFTLDAMGSMSALYSASSGFKSQPGDCLDKGFPWCSSVTPGKYIIHSHDHLLPYPFYSLIHSFDATPSKPLTASLNNYLHAAECPQKIHTVSFARPEPDESSPHRLVLFLKDPF